MRSRWFGSVGNRPWRGLVRVVAVGAVLAMAATGCSAVLSESAVSAPNGTGWDPQSVAPLAVAPGGAGASAPWYPNSVVSEGQGLAVSLRPTLKVAAATVGQQHEFTIMTVGGAQDKLVWQEQAGTNQILVGPGVLRQGNVYLWQAKNLATGASFGPYSMLVDAERSSLQPHQAFGPFGVDLAAGSVSLAQGLRGVAGASGSLGVRLHYQVAQPGSPGLPPGWLLLGSGQGWSHLQTFANGAVAMVTVLGMTRAFAPNADGSAFTPVAAPGRPTSSGDLPTLARNSDGSWTATMPSGLVVMFGQADKDGVAPLTASYSGTTAEPQYQYTDGKLTSVRDAVSNGLSVDLRYQGSDDCPAAPDAFVDTPDGMLCSVAYPDGSATSLFYLRDSAGDPLLARLVDYPDTSDAKPSVTDIGYDQAARVVAVREPLAVDALASGVRTDADQLISTVDYDSLGRVATVTKPVALAGAVQPSYSIAYDSAAGQTTVTAAGPKTTTGYSLRHTYDQATLLPLSTTDSKGKTTSQTWDTGKDLQLSIKDQNGRTTQFGYDETDNPISITGPFNGTAPISSTANETYSYDQDVSGEQWKDLNGFNVTYWANDTLTAGPSGREFGPQLDGRVPANAAFNWPTSPTGGGSDPWSARLTGVLTATSGATKTKNKRRAGGNTGQAGAGNVLTYGFAISPGSARLWVDGVACVTGQTPGRCALPLAGGDHQLRVDVPVSNPGEGGGSGVSLSWAPPGATSFAPVPMTAITPGYGLRSVTKKNEALSASQDAQSTLVSDFSQPWMGKPTSSWVHEAPGLKGATSYEDFAPSAGSFGRVTTSTLPAGNQTAYAYYGADEAAEVPCDGMGTINQHGRPKSVTRTTMPGRNDDSGTQVYDQYFDTAGRVIASRVSGTVVGCAYFNDAGQIAQATTPQRGDQPATTTTYGYMPAGDPFKGTVTFQVGDDTYTTNAETDLFGRTVNSTDVWGTTQAHTYDPYTGNTLSTTTTTSSGRVSTGTASYSADGDLVAVTLDGKTVATLSTPSPSGGTVTYGNGVTEKASPNAVGGFGSQAWTSADGKGLAYSTSTSPTGRVLTESFGFAAANASFQYSYDLSGRLTNAELATALPVAHKSWAYEFGANPLGSNPNAGMNSNRTKQTIDKTTEIGYGYNANDQLTNTTDPNIGDKLSYTAWGEIATLGSLSLDYDNNGQVARITDSASGDQIAYSRVAGAVVTKTVTKTSGGTSTTTVSRYSAGGFILDENKTPKWQVVGLPGGTTLLRDMGGAEQWQHQTARGQHMWTSDSTGHDTGEYDLYSPFGEPLIASPPPAPGDGQKPNYQWQAGNGLETQQAGTLAVINMGARLYIPSLGRFTGPDPVNQGSINAYDYADQDPINQADPSGTMSSNVMILISAAVQIIALLAATVLTGGLSWIGISASAATTGARMGYLAGSMAIAALTSVGANALSQAILYPPGKAPFYESTVNYVSTFVSVMIAGWLAKAALAAAAATRAATAAATQVVAAFSEAAATQTQAVAAAIAVAGQEARNTLAALEGQFGQAVSHFVGAATNPDVVAAGMQVVRAIGGEAGFVAGQAASGAAREAISGAGAAAAARLTWGAASTAFCARWSAAWAPAPALM